MRLRIAFLALVTIMAGDAAQAAITEVSVARGHHLYGVRQRLYKSARLATGHTLTGEAFSAPPGGDPAHLSVQNVAHVGLGYYTFDLYANVNAVEGDYVVRFWDHGLLKVPGGKYLLQRTLTVHVKEIVVVTVSFLEGSGSPGALTTKKAQLPQDVVVEAPEWQDGVKNDPAAYVRNTGTKHIKAKLFGPPSYTCSVDATGTWGGVDPRQVSFDASGVAVDSSFQISSPVPTGVDHAQIGWQWRATKAGATQPLNTTSHEIYVVYANNSMCPSRYQTLYEFGCDWAQGKNTESAVYSDIWTRLASLAATPYRYYGTVAGPWETSTRMLILVRDGDCTGWSAFAQDLWGCQGIFVNRVKLVPTTPRNGMLVYATLAGQGGMPTQNAFNFHALHRYGNVYHDSSYGGSPYGAVVDWEDHAVDRYYVPPNLVGDVKGTQEVSVEVW